MRIALELSGGYGGLFAKQPLTYWIDTQDMPKETREKLLELIRDSGLLKDEIRPAAGDARARDTFSYRLSVQDGDRTAELACDDVTAPESIRPLLGFLKNLAMAARL